MSDIQEARRVLKIEAEAILDAIEKLDQNFEEAVRLMLDCAGKVIVTGMGKSGLVGRKIAATLSSTGTSAVFLHPAESAHGDMGVITERDVVLAISQSGESEELESVVRYSERKNIPLIVLSGHRDSTLGKAGVFIDVSVKEEACPLRLAPTSSSTVTLAIGDALAMALLNRRGFKKEDFAEFHPHGSLGRRLLTRVRDIMHTGDSLPLLSPDSSVKELVTMMTAKDVRGVAGVIDDQDRLLGVVTDGDLRRKLEKGDDPMNGQVSDLMSRNPKTIDKDELAEKALFVMEQFRIQTLFAIDKNSSNPRRPVGLIHLQDLLTAKIR